jgi:D-alanyl-D-alanine carboxypeptidase
MTRKSARTAIAVVAMTVALMGSLASTGAYAATSSPASADLVLDRLLQRLVAAPGGPPGVAVVVNRGSGPVLHTAGVADVETGAPIDINDHMRLASVAKAFSGAAALSLVASGQLSLSTTIGQLLPSLPRSWWPVTLRQLLKHTSGVPDFSASPAFVEALKASLENPLPPRQLLSFVESEPLLFPPGSRYQYSNSDNIIVGLMVEAATGQSYERVLASRVYHPLGLTETSLPRGPQMPEPYIHGYSFDPLEDVSELFGAGWSWASGGIVSTPADADRFIRGYVAGRTTDAATHKAQFRFVPGASSEPPGPGRNSAGLGIFRYETTCGTVYGHTGNTAGYTQFIAASADGSRSTVVSVNAQITPSSDATTFRLLRKVFLRAVCAAMA